MRSFKVISLVLVSAFAAWTISRTAEIPFDKHTIDLGANEAAAFADVNGDGKLDLISGENWFEAPGWKKHHFRELDYTNNYIDDFSDLPIDVNADGAIDIVSVSWFGKKIAWWENPGKRGGAWKEHVMETGKSVEFAFLVDLDNDGKARELLPQFGGANNPITWYEIKNGEWVKHEISSKGSGHGIGCGDVNKDGRNDILTSKGWYEAPKDIRAPGEWVFHPVFDLEGAGFLHVLDVNGDGRNDVVTGLAHNYGVLWLEQMPDGKFVKRIIDESWSQPHAMTLVDLNGDGKLDILTGKRYMAHNGKDPGEREPLGIYWYEYVKSADGKRVDWVRHVIDYGTRAGGGMQLAAADFDGDGDMDFAAPGKSGLFLFENLMKSRKAKK